MNHRDHFEKLLADQLANEYPASAESLRASLLGMRQGEKYASMSVTGRMIASQATSAWWGWRESLAAVVVELPQRFYMQPGDGPGVYPQAEHDGEWLDADACRAAIEAAGLKVAQ